MNSIPILHRATGVLEGYGLAVEPHALAGPALALRADARWRVARGRQRGDYVVAIKRNVTRAMVGAVLAQARQLAHEAGTPVLLVTDPLTPPIADTLKDQQQQFVDTAGNAYLECHGWLVWVTGRKAEPLPRARAGRAFTPAGLKILFVLLRDPSLVTRPYREIAVAAGVALGAIPAVVADLQAHGHLLVVDRRRRIVSPPRLLDEWAMAYARLLRPRTLLRTLTTADFDDWRDWDLGPDDALWGGEPAANLLIGHLRPGVLTIYANKIPARLIVAHRMTTPNPGTTTGIVEIRERFWGDDTIPAAPHRTVAPVLVYADLLATGDGRCLETAQRIHEQHLARSLAAA
jgi:hypothetical protein